MPLATGKILHNRYRIVKLLGQGGFGAVYRAWDTVLERACAIKENLDATDEAQRQFQREARLLAKLEHPNLPRVNDYFFIAGQGQYLVMDFVDGQDLQQMLDERGGALPEAQALGWITQVCQALAYLHGQNPPVIHRDLKPANIKVTPDGRVKLVDFGIAKLYDPKLKTTVGARAVTPGYSPHEQYGQGRTDARTDIYALGATLYALLTGQEPLESIQRVGRDRLPPAEQLNPGISAQVAAALRRALAIDPEDRFQSVADLQAALGQVPSAAPVPTPVQTPASVLSEPGKGSTQVVSAGAPQATAVLEEPPVSVRTGQAKPLKLGGGALVLLALGLVVVVGLVWWASNQKPAMPALSHTPMPTAAPAVQIDGVLMVLIPTGEFQMGSESGNSDEKPVHTVYLDDYYIDVYEVTNARYIECVTAGRCDPPDESKSYTRSSYYGNPEYADYPVVYVTWEMADTYCQWRGGRLPTEAEWEKAARGGLEDELYPWGDEAPTCKQANFNGSGCVGDTSPVGSYVPNGYGLYDMAGNVWEWVQDWYLESFYGGSPRDNPTGPVSGQYRVLRGGSWYLNVGYLRVARRGRNAPADSDNWVGFRCARSVSTADAPMPTEIPGGGGVTTSAPPPTIPPPTEKPRPTATQPLPTVAPPAPISDVPMVLIPAGEFQMGSESGDSDETPVRTVYLDAYYIDVYEVTSAHYAECVESGICDPPVDSKSYTYSSYYGNPEYKDYPVIYISWGMANTYCQWRGGRLPTEAEWEKAARGGLEGKRYPWGDGSPNCERANYQHKDGACVGDTSQVGNYASNGYGLYDMAGNVWEWVQDWYQETFYSISVSQNPVGPITGQYRVVRGGSWSDIDVYMFSANRSGNDPSYSNDNLGFRCVALLKPPE